ESFPPAFLRLSESRCLVNLGVLGRRSWIARTARAPSAPRPRRLFLAAQADHAPLALACAPLAAPYSQQLSRTAILSMAMRKRYEQWMYEWETHLTTRDNNRVVRPFEWGLDWACRWPLVNGNFPADESGAERFLHELNRRIIAESDTFFSYVTPGDFRLERRKVERFATGSDREQRNRDVPDETGEFLRFTSPVHTPYPENNLVNARWFPARGRRAVVVMPQWNSDALSHNSLCRMFNLMGIAALRLSMPYHDIRMPAHLERADYAVSANIARTTDAARQAVIDVRACLDWLQQQGYSRLGILGTSLGSCYAFLAAAHDRRVAVNAFNHASTYFADVVWTGQ